MSVSTTLWRRVLIYTHRWLGIAGSLLFVVWFVSGIVMMYARMPHLEPAKRLARAPALDFTTAEIAPARAVRKVDVWPQRLRLGMIGDRPVYRFATGPLWTTIFADNGQLLDELRQDDAQQVVRDWVTACRCQICLH